MAGYCVQLTAVEVEDLQASRRNGRLMGKSAEDCALTPDLKRAHDGSKLPCGQRQYKGRRDGWREWGGGRP